VVPEHADQKPRDIALAALDHARRHYFDVLLVDTAGRLAIDEALMAEIRELHAALNPVETLFVVDAMQGQDAVNTAKAFKEALPLTGIMLTKLTATRAAARRCRCARSPGLRSSLPAPVEKIDGLEVFDAERHAGRVLGMGDIVALVEEVQKGVDMAGGAEAGRQGQERRGFDLDDFLAQIQQMKKMGGLSSLMDKLPSQMAAKASGADMTAPKKTSRRMEGIIHSDDAAGAPQARTASRPAASAASPPAPACRCRRSTACSRSSSRCRA
jgi:signal recognition particle subunit SRP54